jgi:hypothetical protein
LLLSIFGSGEMLNYQQNAPGGFTPAAVAPPNAITPKRYYFVIAPDCRSGLGGQALYSSSSYQYLIFHIIAKGILKSLNFTNSLIVRFCYCTLFL